MMENFILYEEVGTGSRSVVYKGRRKGSLSFVAIFCTDKNKRPEITNHVRLCLNMNHRNVVSFYEWYETSNHLWMVVELCTGGSLETVIGQDGCLPEDIVRIFGWDIVRGLKHIHQSGIIYSDLTPAKVLLDGGVLKLSNFFLSRTEEESLEDIFALLSVSEPAGGPGGDRDKGNPKEDIRKRVQGSPVYSAPEVLQGGNTSTSSDLWALGCILYHMYSGKPPFCSDSYNELAEMIAHQEPPPLRQKVSEASPSSEFQNLLRGLLNKNPNERMGWPELLGHPFWAQEEEEEEEWSEDEEGEDEWNNDEEDGNELDRDDSNSLIAKAAAHRDSNVFTSEPTATPTSCCVLVGATQQGDSGTRREASMNNGSLEQDPARPTGRGREGKKEDAKQASHTLHPNKSFTLDSVSELRPKSADKDNAEGLFLLRLLPENSSLFYTRGQYSFPSGDTTTCVKALLYKDSDYTVTAVIDNPKILRSPAVRFDSKTLCVPAYSVEKLRSLSNEEWSVFLPQLCSCLDGTTLPPAPASSSPGAAPLSPLLAASRPKLNLLCYLCSVVSQRDVANTLINSSLLPVLTRQLQHASNWDVRSKVLRVIGLLAHHCTMLSEQTPISEVACTITDLLRDNQRNNRAKQLLLPPLGELHYLIASQEEERDSPEAAWFVPAAAYTSLMRSLREGDDTVVQHMAVKTIENISAIVSDSRHRMVTTETGPSLWYLFTHSTVEAVRITAISSLSRLTRTVPGVFLSVIDSCGPAAIFDGLGVAPPRVQQHLLTATAAALLGSHVHMHTHRLAQDEEVVLKVLRCLESPSTLTRAKAFLLLLMFLQGNTETLLYCCQHRLVMYLERDLRKATPLRENSNQSEHLSQCLRLMVVHLTSAAPLILEKVLSALGSVVGRRHPPTAQSKNLKNALPSLSIVLDLLSSQVFQPHIVSGKFLQQIGMLLNYITSVKSSETNLATAVGATACEELIRTTLSIVEILTQHRAVINTHHGAVVKAIMPSLVSLAFSRNDEWCACVLRVLSELCPLLLAPEGSGTEKEEEEVDESAGRDGEKSRRQGGSRVKLAELITKSLLPRYVSFLTAAEPIPLYALKLLVAVTEHNTNFCRLIKHSAILQSVLQLIKANSCNVSRGLIQTGVTLLCNLSGGPEQDLEPLYQQGLIEVVVSVLKEAVLHYLDGDMHSGRKGSLLALLSQLELLQYTTSSNIHQPLSALHFSQRLSCPATEMDAAEKLLLANRPLNQLNTYLILMLPTEDQEVGEESLQCLSLLVQLYGGGEGPDCLSRDCLRSFLSVLRADGTPPRARRTTLRVLKRLVQTADRCDWLECTEGAELKSLLQDLVHSSGYSRPQDELATEAAEILHEIHTPNRTSSHHVGVFPTEHG